jgi:hypothetical protein
MEDLTNISQDGEFEMSIGHFPKELINKKFFDKENNENSIQKYFDNDGNITSSVSEFDSCNK